MDERNDGGPAFPWGDVTNGGVMGGMSLRDYFAAKAMQAYISNTGFSGWPGADAIASYAYRDADAMLAERDK